MHHNSKPIWCGRFRQLKTKMIEKKTLAGIAVLMLLLIAANASAIGVSPGTVAFNKLVRGGYAEK